MSAAFGAAAAATYARVGALWNGYWVVDPSRSGSPACHLEALGLPDMAQAAANQIQPAYYITVAVDGFVTIKHSSEIGEKERVLRVGVEHVEAAKDGAGVKMLLSLPAPNVMVNAIEWSGRGKITDTKTLVDDGHGGLCIHQRIDMVHARSGKVSSSERIMVRGEAEE